MNGTNLVKDVFQIANDSALIGLDISGRANGVYGNTVSGFTLRDLNVNGADRSGFVVDTFTGGTLSDYTASGNGFYMQNLPVVNSAVFSLNTSTNNMDLGYSISGTPSDGEDTNTGSGNGGGNNNFQPVW